MIKGKKSILVPVEVHSELVRLAGACQAKYRRRITFTQTIERALKALAREEALVAK